MTRFCTILMTTCILASPALAEAGARGDRMFQRLDADADGQVTLAEVTARKTEVFTTADANADGNLSLAEFTGINPLFDRADADGDGIVTRAEFDENRGQHRP